MIPKLSINSRLNYSLGVSKNLEATKHFANELMETKSGIEDLVGEIFNPTAIVYSMFEPQVGSYGAVEHCSSFMQAFPDLHYNSVDYIEEGNKSLVVMDVKGTHREDFYGIKAKGNPIRFNAVASFNYDENNEVSKYKFSFDTMSVMQQLDLNMVQIMQLIPEYCKSDAQVLSEALQFMGANQRVLSHMMVLCIVYKYAGFVESKIAAKLGLYTHQVHSFLEQAQTELGCANFKQLIECIRARRFAHVLQEYTKLLVRNT